MCIKTVIKELKKLIGGQLWCLPWCLLCCCSVVCMTLYYCYVSVVHTLLCCCSVACMTLCHCDVSVVHTLLCCCSVACMTLCYCDVSVAHTPKSSRTVTPSDWIKPFDLGKLHSACLEFIVYVDKLLFQ